MAEAELEKTEIQISSTGVSELFITKGEVVVFPGYLKAYQSANQKDPTILPKLSQGDNLTLLEASATQTFARPPARYSEASLVKKTGSRRYWPAKYLCANYFNHTSPWLCPKIRWDR